MKSLKIACFGDICGETGRIALIDYLARNGSKFDIVIANGENTAHGFGINQKICDLLFDVGVYVITLGNHTFDQKADLSMFETNKNLIRPLNYPKKTPGKGFTIIHHNNSGANIMVVNLIGRLFMELNDDPFTTMDELLNVYCLGIKVDAIIVDFHAEATSEKVALAQYLDGRVSAIFGTHTHIPTADAQILTNGTGYLTDCGMCGDYNSVIGMQSIAPVLRFTDKVKAHTKLSPASNLESACVCGVVFEINQYGKCENIRTIRSGGNWLIEQQNYE